MACASKTYMAKRSLPSSQCVEALPSVARQAHQEHPMLDIVMLALGLGFFVASIGYAYACERL